MLNTKEIHYIEKEKYNKLTITQINRSTNIHFESMVSKIQLTLVFILTLVQVDRLSCMYK